MELTVLESGGNTPTAMPTCERPNLHDYRALESRLAGAYESELAFAYDGMKISV